MEEQKLLGFDFSLASARVIEILIEDAADPEIFREILTAGTRRPEIVKLLVGSPNVPDGIREEAAKLLTLPVKEEATFPAARKEEERKSYTEEQRKQSLLQKIRSLTVGEKIALALKGSRDLRSILSKDSNKEVVLSVLKNPKVTETEAEMIAHSRNIPEEALRFISKNREWMKNYNVVVALVNNPKTPAGIGSSLVPGLKTKDIVTLEKNKNVSEAVRIAAKRMLQTRKPH